MQASLQIIFSPVTALLRDTYQTSESIIDSNATVFFIINIIFNLPTVFFLESGETEGEGLSKWFKISGFLMILGQWGRFLVIKHFPNQFWLTIIPAAIIAIGQPFLTNGISKLACIWFGDHQRTIAISILSISMALGTCIGFCIASFFIHESNKEDHAKIKEQTNDFMWFISISNTILCAPLIFFYQQRPKTYPSRSAKESANLIKKRKLSVMDELPILWKNKNFRQTFFLFSTMNGSANTLAATITFLIEPFGFNSIDSSIMGATSVVSGFVSSFIFPIIL